MTLERPLVFFDIETTGLDKNKDKIVEISMVKVNPDGSKQSMTERINPLVPIPESVSLVHGITDEDVKDCPTFKERAGAIATFLRGCDVGGFNSNNFDIPFLYNEITNAGFVWDVDYARFVDVGNLFKIHEPRTLTGAVKFYLDADHSEAHSAEADVMATIDVFQAMIDKYELPEDMETLAEHCNFGNKRLGVSGHFTYDANGEIVFNFGKHKGELAKENKSYLYWMQNADFPPDTIGIVKDILRK